MATRPASSRGRQVTVTAWLAYLALLLLALLAPSSAVQSQLVQGLSSTLQALPVIPPEWVAYPRMEVVSNAAIIAPVSLLGSFVWPRLRWQDWTAYGFLGALTVETVQAVLLPGRQGAFSDVVANAGGAMMGAWAYAALRWFERRRGSASRGSRHR